MIVAELNALSDAAVWAVLFAGAVIGAMVTAGACLVASGREIRELDADLRIERTKSARYEQMIEELDPSLVLAPEIPRPEPARAW